jgi:hypothetical protein
MTDDRRTTDRPENPLLIPRKGIGWGGEMSPKQDAKWPIGQRGARSALWAASLPPRPNA